MSSTENSEYLMKCPNCNEYFDDEIHSPRVLPCLHTCCSKCLKTFIAKKAIQCRECKEIFDATKKDASSFPVDSARKHIVDSYRIQKKGTEFFCEECQSNGIKNVIATSQCKECVEFLCAQCTDAHQRTNLTKRHKLISIDTLKNSPIREVRKQTCHFPGHEGQPISYYCIAETCDQPICSVCVARDHQQSHHDVRSINDVYVENKRLLESHLLDMKHVTTTLDEAIGHIENETQNLLSRDNAAGELLEASFTSCVKAMERRKEELKKKLFSVSQNKKKDLDHQRDQMATQKGKIEQACKFSEDHIKNSNVAEFLLMRNHIFNRITDLKDHQPDVIPRVTSDIKFQPINMEEEFLELCQKMGNVQAIFAYIPNTEVRSFDVVVGKEQIPFIITLHDFKNRPVDEGGMDIKVDIINFKNQKMAATVRDFEATQGCHEVLFTAPRDGEYRGIIHINGICLSQEGYSFKAKRENQLETESGKRESRGQKKNMISPRFTAKNGHNFVEKLNLHGLNGTASSEDSQSFKTYGDVCPEIIMDVLHLHPQNEMSEDKKTQTNQKNRRKTPRNTSRTFQNFRGTIGSRPMNTSGQTYFEVQIHFFIKRSMRQDLIFEIGLCRKSDVDKYYCIDGHPSAYVVCARKCHVCRTICLQAWNYGRRLYHTPIKESSPPGTTYRATYGFLLDTEHKVWIIADARRRNFIFKFTNVDLSKPLWPVFGVYNPDLCNTYLTLRSGEEITSVLELPDDISI